MDGETPASADRTGTTVPKVNRVTNRNVATMKPNDSIFFRKLMKLPLSFTPPELADGFGKRLTLPFVTTQRDSPLKNGSSVPELLIFEIRQSTGNHGSKLFNRCLGAAAVAPTTILG